MNILAFESTCDETAVAVVADGRTVLSDAIASQVDMHTIYGGVVPEIASRKHVEAIAGLAEKALADAGLTRADIDAVAVSYAPGLIGAVLAAAIFDRSLFLKVDYALLATFVCFFVFVGNIARVEAVSGFFSQILEGRELIVSVALSQVISNVPAAVMLSGFTENGAELLLGVNLGGLGTIIASLASLISFQFYRKSEGARSGRYLLSFTLVSVVLLAVLLGFEMVWRLIFS